MSNMRTVLPKRSLCGLLIYAVVFFNVCSVIPGSVKASRVRILHEDQVFGLRPGQRLELQCEFYMEQFDLFHNPVIWNKGQLNETTPINIMSNILEPFVGTERFRVKLIMTEPTYRLILTIRDAQLEDYGNYTCEIRGVDSSPLTSIRHLVYVRDPVESMLLTEETMEDPVPWPLPPQPQRLTYTEPTPSPVYCLAVGGCPPPRLSLHVGPREVAEPIEHGYTSALTGPVGLRQVTHYSRLWAPILPVTPDMDGAILSCRASVTGSVVTAASTFLLVRHAPVVRCDQTYARPGDRHVTLRCVVRARPGASLLYWRPDSNGTETRDSQHQFVNIDRGEGVIETRLYINEVSVSSFEVFQVIAENDLGKTMHQAQLIERDPDSPVSVLRVMDEDRAWAGGEGDHSEESAHSGGCVGACRAGSLLHILVIVAGDLLGNVLSSR